MLVQFHSFLHLLFIGIIALFPVVNPIGSALIINPYLSRLSEGDKRNAVRKITLYAFFICIVSLFAGHWILELFGISIPVIQVAGGILICKMGWTSLSSDQQENSDKKITEEENTNRSDISDQLFYPLTFPITTGAGTISVLFTLSAHSADKNWENYLINTSAIILAILFMCALVFFFYSHTKKIIEKLGANGQNIANRIFAFLIFCVGLEIAITGAKTIFHSF
ncbi:multiple antibiotic resistance protein [Chryseobacterium sp. SORGH_AS 447]|uniref:MarC family protein n=1 Tax=Chryseobacterium sp. SORGH_AS_0447 TaxID=3041769 RepID=UPI002786AB9C|nr:MarC family protein [Chryseobacterium sp. SORGH_AS_0447]MDQ1161599.1 multiple antibiotic resistance protein [Chryseobacterium sp. SORGH_AS_0447]